MSMDNLSKCMVQCEKDGFGVHYGRWRATQEDVQIIGKVPDGWRKCKHCGKTFKPYNNQLYCEVRCQNMASRKREKDRKAQLISVEEVALGDTETVGE